MHSLLKRQLRKFFGEHVPAELHAFAQAVDESYASFETDAQILHRAMEISSEELNQANSEVRAVIEAIPDVILKLDRAGHISPLKMPSRSSGSDDAGLGEDRIRRQIASLANPAIRASYQAALDALMAGARLRSFEYTVPAATGESTFEVRMVPLREGGAIAIIQDITARRLAEAEHERLNRELVAISRQAGMAEIATGVLHNVGNALNSANVSANLIVNQLRRTNLSSLAKAVGLLREHHADLATYLTADPKGCQVPRYLEVIADQLGVEHASLTTEIQGLRANLEHIKQIVSMQQSYAKVGGALEPMAAPELIDDALRMLAPALASKDITVTREFSPAPRVLADRHKVLQILVNLIGNAKQALESITTERRVVIRIIPDLDRVRIEVADNGVGIPADNLARIFSHGFTTKKTGHGFGLHSCANAAKELGGVLSVHSAGAGLGATFTLELPAAKPAAQPAAA